MIESIDNIQYASLLYDFYGELLGNSRREVMDLYHEDNLSLAEIAEELGQTRQGVHYTLKKAESKLREYEGVLGLVERHLVKVKLLGRLDEIGDELIADGNLSEGTRTRVEELVALVHELSE